MYWVGFFLITAAAIGSFWVLLLLNVVPWVAGLVAFLIFICGFAKWWEFK